MDFDVLAILLKCSYSVTLVYRDETGRSRGLLFKLLAEPFGCLRCTRSFVPGDLQGSTSLHGRPSRVSYDGPPARRIDVVRELRNKAKRRNRKNGANTRDSFGSGRVKALHLATEMRTARDNRKEHSGHADIDAKHRAAIHFAGQIDPRNRFADEVKIASRFQSYTICFDLRELGSCFHQFAIRKTAPARTVHDRATLGSAILLINSPLLRRRGEKHFTGLGTHLAHVIPCCSCATTAAGGQILISLRNDGRLFYTNGGPVGFQFIGKHHRVHGSRTLAHFRYFGEHGDLVVGRDPDPGMGRENLAAMNVPSGRRYR